MNIYKVTDYHRTMTHSMEESSPRSKWDINKKFSSYPTPIARVMTVDNFTIIGDVDTPSRELLTRQSSIVKRWSGIMLKNETWVTTPSIQIKVRISIPRGERQVCLRFNQQGTNRYRPYAQFRCRMTGLAGTDFDILQPTTFRGYSLHSAATMKDLRAEVDQALNGQSSENDAPEGWIPYTIRGQ